MQKAPSLLLAALAASSPGAQSQTWETTVVAEHSGMQPNLGTDPLGNLHLVWFTSSADKRIHYASSHSGSWEHYRQFLDLGIDYWSPVVEGDGMGCFHILVRASALDAHYYTNNTNRWNAASTYVPYDTPYDISCHGHHVNLEVSSEDKPQVFRECDGRIHHQRNTHQIFNDYTTSDPDHDFSVIHQWSTAMESDILHAAVRLTPTDITEATIFYTTKEPGSFDDYPWAPVEEVQPGGWPSIITQDGIPHLVYTHGYVMYYTHRTGGAWSTPENIGGIDDPAHTGIAIDDNGAVHAVWVERAGDIYYTNNIGGSWLSPSVVGVTGSRDWQETHMDDKLALDIKSNTVYIAYSTDDQTLLVHTSEYTLRNESDGGTSTFLEDSGFTPPTELTLNNATETDPLTLLRFSITDAGDDGLPTEISSVFFQAGPEQYFDDERASWYYRHGLNSFVAAASLVSDSGANPEVSADPDWIIGDKIVFQAESGALLTVADGATETFSLKIQAQFQNSHWEGFIVDLVLRGSYDIETLETGSQMAFDQPIVVTGPISYHYEPLDTGVDTGPDTGANDSGTDTSSADTSSSDTSDTSDRETGAEKSEGRCSCTQGPRQSATWGLLLFAVLARRPRGPSSSQQSSPR